MSTENQNSAGTTSALAQKTGIKPLAKIIAGVCAAIVVVVALCSIFGDPSGVAAVKKHVWKEYDETVTFEEAVARFCEKTSVDKDFTEDKPCRGKKKGLLHSGMDGFRSDFYGSSCRDLENSFYGNGV